MPWVLVAKGAVDGPSEGQPDPNSSRQLQPTHIREGWAPQPVWWHFWGKVYKKGQNATQQREEWGKPVRQTALQKRRRGGAPGPEDCPAAPGEDDGEAVCPCSQWRMSWWSRIHTAACGGRNIHAVYGNPTGAGSDGNCILWWTRVVARLSRRTIVQGGDPYWRKMGKVWGGCNSNELSWAAHEPHAPLGGKWKRVRNEDVNLSLGKAGDGRKIFQFFPLFPTIQLNVTWQ